MYIRYFKIHLEDRGLYKNFPENNTGPINWKKLEVIIIKSKKI